MRVWKIFRKEERGLNTDVKETNDNILENKKLRNKTWFKVLCGIGLAVLLLSGTVFAYANYALSKVNYEDRQDIEELEKVEDYFEIDAVDVQETENIKSFELDTQEDIKEVQWKNEEQKMVKPISKVYNFLLCGVEAIGGGRGRTDCMILVTVNQKENKLKLTSLMRDTYVAIEGYKDNKLNAAYQQGGISLLVDTIEKNFQVKIDGYAVVNFDGFKQIIDKLGGVEIELSKKEANYLNTTNYIADKKYRNVKEGKQILNGEQALGYSRIRHVPTPNGLRDDFGRNYRQRAVLKSIFKQYKNKNVFELITIIPDLLELVTTDLSKKDIIRYMGIVLSMDVGELETNKVPMKGTYEITTINGMSVLYITDIDKVRSELHTFIYGDELVELVNNDTKNEENICIDK